MQYKSIKDIFGLTAEEIGIIATKAGESLRLDLDNTIMDIILKSAGIYNEIPSSGEIKSNQEYECSFPKEESILEKIFGGPAIIIPFCIDCKGTGEYIGAGINPPETCLRCKGVGHEPI